MTTINGQPVALSPDRIENRPSDLLPAKGQKDAAGHRQLSVFGVPISALTMGELLSMIDGWIVRRERHYLCTLDVHALMESQSAPDVRHIYQSASIVTPDGVPLVWLLRRAGYRQADRICGPDLMPALFERSQHASYRHFLYGASESTLVLLKRNLLARFPAATIVGCYSPPYRALTAQEERDTVSRLNEAAPDIVWVGLGAPKQDRWMGAYRAKLNAPVLIGVGAAFDMMAGTVKRAPRFMQRTGCEWAFRVMQEPGRLWRRYLGCNSRFAIMVVNDQLRHLRDKRA